MSRSAPITVVIVTYNSAGTVDAALEALADGHAAGTVRVIVVDNASTDDTAGSIESRFPWVDVVASKENVGFGRGCNIGLSMAEGEYVLFLNPDAVLPVPALAVLQEHLEQHPQAAVVAPAILNPSGAAQKIHPLPTPWRVFAAAAGWRIPPSEPIPPGSAPRRTDWLCGAVLLTRREVMVELGGFDPRFFLYFEETDLCRRVCEAGHELWVTGAAVASHLAGASTAKTNETMHGQDISKHYYESRFYYLRKHFGVIAAAVAECAELTVVGMRSLVKRLTGRRDSRFRDRLRAPILRSPPRARTEVLAE